MSSPTSTQRTPRQIEQYWKQQQIFVASLGVQAIALALIFAVKESMGYVMIVITAAMAIIGFLTALLRPAVARRWNYLMLFINAAVLGLAIFVEVKHVT